MVVEVYMPKMSDHMELGEILDWLVGEGEHVEKGQPLLEIQTDKVVAELDAPASGFVKGIRRGAVPGAEVPVGETLAFIVTDDTEQVPVLASLSPSDERSSPDSEEPLVMDRPEHQAAADSGAIRATPVSRRLAKELGVDLTTVQGSGPGGRIREADVRAVAEANSVAPEVVAECDSSDEWFDLTAYQRVTARQMTVSAQTIPQFVLDRDVDVTSLLRLRTAMSEKIEKDGGLRLTITALLVKLIGLSLRDCPRANASFENGRVRQHWHVNVGVAVGTPAGVAVPVIHDADSLDLGDIVQKLAHFREAAAEVQFRAGELADGTFTISNLGMYGVDRFTAMVNPPQAAILAVGRITERPARTAEGTIALCPQVTLSVTVDHRVLDGVQGAQFLDDIARRVEQPWGLL